MLGDIEEHLHEFLLEIVEYHHKFLDALWIFIAVLWWLLLMEIFLFSKIDKLVIWEIGIMITYYFPFCWCSLSLDANISIQLMKIVELHHVRLLIGGYYNIIYINSLDCIFFCSCSSSFPPHSSAISDYRQSLQFQVLNEEKQNIQLEVCMVAWECLSEFISFLVMQFVFCK